MRRLRRVIGSVIAMALACSSDDTSIVAADSSGTTDAVSTSMAPAGSSSAGVSTEGATGDEPSTSTPGSTSASDGASSSESTGMGLTWPPPPGIVLSSEVAARGGWLYLVVEAPITSLALDLDGVDLGEPDERIPSDEPVGVWRVPDDTALGPATLSLRWIDHPNVPTDAAIEIVEPRFVDVAQPTGLAQIHDVTGSPEDCAQSHTGVAVGDYDADGLPDLYVGNVGSEGRLHHNGGNIDADPLPDFEDVTDLAGLDGVDSVGMATFVDLEGDGDLDLFIGRRGTDRMFENLLVPDGVATFVDVTSAVGLDLYSQRTMGAAFGDYDGDEDLDLYVVNHAWCFPGNGEALAEDHLYRNDGGVFVERTADLGVGAGISVGFSAAWVDIERDGDQDLIVINDDVGGAVGDPNEVWRNDGPGGAGEWSFTDVSAASGVAIPEVNGMGLALADVDGDGFVDLAFSNIGANVLMLNDGSGSFVDVSESAGIQRTLLPWGRNAITWGTHLWDHDNDGDEDLYFTGGAIVIPGPLSDAFFDNAGDGTFVELTWESALADPAHGKASALVDLDRDGAWDLVTAAWGDDLRVWRNQAVPAVHHFVDIELRGRLGNREAIGAIVELTSPGREQTCFHTQRPSLGAGGELACHFGLGVETEVTALQITWPDGTVQAIDPAALPAIDARTGYDHPGG